MKSSLTILVLIGFTLFAVSCSPTHERTNHPPLTSASNPASLVGTEWLLTDLLGKAVVPNSQASLTFLDGGRAAGNASCNRFTGGVTISGNSITFGQLASTRMACVDSSVSAQEDQYLKILGAARRYEVKDNSLLIFAEGVDQPLRFSRQTNAKP